MTGQARANSTNQLLARILALATGEAPLVLVVEDAHWLDSASWALVQEVRQTVDSLLLVILTRPMATTEEEMTPVEYRRLAADDRTVHLPLAALPAPETLALVEQRLGITSLPEPVGRLILHKSEGHPFLPRRSLMLCVMPGGL
jgi:predicted ATPase